MKYTSPFYWARIYQGVDVETSIAELERIYDHWLADPSTTYLSGSDVDFSDHMTMHGYLLTKDKIPNSLKDKVKRFLQLSDFNTFGTGTSTLNMDMMHAGIGYMPLSTPTQVWVAPSGRICPEASVTTPVMAGLR